MRAALRHVGAHLLRSEGHVVLQAPQKLGSVFRFAQKGPLLVAQGVRLGFRQLTLQIPVTAHMSGVLIWHV